MGLADAYQDETDQAIQTTASLPLDPTKPKPKHSGWTTIPRALGAAGTEISANVLDIAGAYGKTVTAYGAASSSPFGQTEEEKAQSVAMQNRLAAGEDLFRNPQSESLYTFARNLRPDPSTASTAENITFSLTKGLSKAIGSSVIAGPVAGITAFGTSEGLATSEDLAVEGVDKTTRTKVGTLTGVLTGGSALIPVAGSTIGKTIGLAVVGGPAAFIAQQAATKEILSNANYDDLAKQYDPLDPTGLAVATLLPAGFGAWAMRGAKAPKPIKSSSKIDSPQSDVESSSTLDDSGLVPTNEQIDAVMTHHLTLTRDIHETTDPREFALKSLQQLHDAHTNEIAELLPIAGNRAEPGAVSTIKAEISRIDYDLSQLDQYFSSEAKRLQGDGLSRKQAESASRKLIEDKRQDLQSRRSLLDDQIGLNADATQAEQRIAVLQKLRSETTSKIEQATNGRFESEPPIFLNSDEMNVSDLTAEERSGPQELSPIQAIVERVQTFLGGDTESKERIKHLDPRIESALNRIEELSAKAPDMHVAVNDQGERVDLKSDLDAVKREVREGTDDHLGTMDADLLKVAAECFLTVGSV